MMLSGDLFRRNNGALSQLLLYALVLGTAIASGVAAASGSLLAFALLLALPFGLALLLQPDYAVLAVIFGLYSNMPVLGVRFHGIPYIVGAAFPLLLALPLVINLLFLRRKLVFTQIFPLLIVFLAIQLIGALFSENIGEAADNVMVFLIEGLALFFLIVNTVRTRAMLRQVIWTLVLVGVLLGGVPLYQQLTGTFDNHYGGFAQISEGTIRTGEENIQGEVRQPRLAGAIGEQNRYAQIMLMLVPLGLFLFWGERSKLLKLLALVGAGFAAAGMALAFSRGAAIGFVLMLLLMVVTRNIKLYQFLALIAVGVLLLAAFPQYGLRLTSLQGITGLISPQSASGEELDGALRGRATAMLGAAYAFMDHPVFGVGPGMTKYYTREYGNRLGIRILTEDREAHSLYLGIASDNGALGLLCFLAILFVTLRGLILARKRWLDSRTGLANLITGLLMALVSYMATGLFLHMSYVRYFWLVLALAHAAIEISKQENPNAALNLDPVEGASQ